MHCWLEKAGHDFVNISQKSFAILAELLPFGPWEVVAVFEFVLADRLGLSLGVGRRLWRFETILFILCNPSSLHR